MKKLNNESGRSMIEMLGVLAIIGVLSVGGIAGYSKAMMKYRTNKTIEQITLIAGNVRTFFANQENYAGVYCHCEPYGCFGGDSLERGCPILKKAKILPDEMITIDSSGKITSMSTAFGGSFLIRDSGRFANDKKAFFINIDGLPEEACIELATHNWQNIGAMAVAAGDFAYALMQGYNGSGEGCDGDDGDGSAPLTGCQNGSNVSLPLPFDKVVNACTEGPNVAIKFR